MEIENISEDDKDKVHQLCQRTEDDFEQLIEILDPKKYPKARAYIQNLSKIELKELEEDGVIKDS